MLAKTNSIALEVHFKEIEKLRKVPKSSRRCRTHKCVITAVAPVSSVRLKAGARDPQADPAVSELVCNAAELTEKPLEQNLVVNEAKSQSFGPTLSARYAMAKARSLDKQIVLRTDSSTDLTANAVDSLAVGVCPAEVLICIAAESQNLQIERAMNVSHQGARLVECGTGNTTLPPIATPRSIEKKLPEKTSVSASGKGLKDNKKELSKSKATGNPASKPRAVKLQTAKKPSFDRTKAPSKQSRGKLNLNRAQCEDVVQGKSPFVLNRFVLLYLDGVKVNKPAYLRAVLENGGVKSYYVKHVGFTKEGLLELLVNANSMDKVKAIFTEFKNVKTFDNYLNRGSLEEIGERLSDLKRRLSWVERFIDNPPVRRFLSILKHISAQNASQEASKIFYGLEDVVLEEPKSFSSL
ncbi:hypothetical protein LUQ84_000700 [Hamiltosporidium tvaerminnensis]|nr:hypothetical protein LUQ84_000700 [Hamiltosporidium tvaerminnensis]